MRIFLCVLIGYFLGSLSPSYFFSLLKKKNLSKSGTGNLGATNAFLVLGKWCGVLVLVFDMGKTVLSFKLAQFLFPQIDVSGILSAAFSIVGHSFPFYLKFRGGKGLACLGGAALAINPTLFLILILICLALTFISNYAVTLAVSGAILFPIFYAFSAPSLFETLISAGMGILVLHNHLPNVKRIKEGREIKLSEYFKNGFKKQGYTKPL